jgi:hypothetical protein
MMLGLDARLAAWAAATLALCCAMPAAGQELWNGARMGMIPAEVERAFPKATQGERIQNGDDMILKVADLRAGGHDATAYFDFSHDRLRTVELHLSAGAAGGAIDTGEIRDQLSAKYGRPVECEAETGKCEWRNGEVDVTLVDTPTPAGDRVEVLYGAFDSGPGAPAADRTPKASPVSLVRSFYEALAAGDGERAAQLIVPPKRDFGPYNPRAMSAFYGSLAEPIQLTAAYPHSGGSVFVRYRFTARGGHVCDGAADVRTAWVEGALLIDSIHSYSGC